MNSTNEDAVTVDHEALRATVQRARELYTGPMRAEAVTQVTEQLRGHLGGLVPLCVALTEQMPAPSAPRRTLENAVGTAQHLLDSQPGGGPMARLVHMQLLADSAAALSARVRTPLT